MVETKVKFVKWNSLNQFHEVMKSLNYNRIYQTVAKNDYKIKYGLKVKLHGTNAAVRITPTGEVIAQKRSSDLIGNADNAGFRAWVEANENYFSRLAHTDTTTIIYGEWAGPGVQTGVACSEMPHKAFFPFALDFHFEEGGMTRWYDPEHIAIHMCHQKMPDDIVIIPWHDIIEMDFADKKEAEKTLIKLNLMTEKVGEQDPLIKELYDIDGCGEGFVAYPFLGESPGLCYVDGEMEHFSHFNFKSKSEAHRVNKTKTAVQIDPEFLSSKNTFADTFCTEQRFMQGFKDCLGEQKDMKLTGDFVRWVIQDVKKESTTEVEALGIPFDKLAKTVGSRAAIWYKDKVAEL